MDKTISYYIEKFCGITLSCLIVFIAWKYWSFFSFIIDRDFFDKVITITTTLFGFLLAILTLLVQSNSATVVAMKKHGSFKRLINYNKTIVLLSAIVCFLSLILLLSRDRLIAEQHIEFLECFGLINLFFFLWACFDTLVFVLIFYKIILSETL
jgi:hypothetical protein